MESERNVETLKPQACPSPGTPGCPCFVRKLTSGSARAPGGQSCSLSGRAGHLMLTVSFSAHVLSSFPRYFAKPVLPICSLQVPDGEPRGPSALLFRRVLRADGVHQRLVGQCAPGHASSGLQSVFLIGLLAKLKIHKNRNFWVFLKKQNGKLRRDGTGPPASTCDAAFCVQNLPGAVPGRRLPGPNSATPACVTGQKPRAELPSLPASCHHLHGPCRGPSLPPRHG